MRFWRDTDIATLTQGQFASLPVGTLGYEWDEDLANGSRPPGLFRLSSTTRQNQPVLQDHGSTYASGTATHNLTMYRHSSGALVFGAGTIQWPWGLDANPRSGQRRARGRRHAAGNGQSVRRHERAARHPAAWAHPPTESSDAGPPSSTITSPSTGATLAAGQAVTVTGTASDTAGMVGGVEVSTDGGTTWLPAQGRDTWTYNWTPSSAGSVTLKTRAADDSGNLETPSAGTTVTVAGQTCPCSIWSNATTPATVERPGHGGRRARSEVPHRRRRLHHRSAVLQGLGEHGHARRSPVDERRARSSPRRLSAARVPPAGSRSRLPVQRRWRRARPTWPPTTRRTAATRRMVAISPAPPSTIRR